MSTQIGLVYVDETNITLDLFVKRFSFSLLLCVRDEEKKREKEKRKKMSCIDNFHEILTD